jgi:DNA-binding MarR family transcriptional regulator
MKKDAVDDILEQWSDERPELDTASLGVVIRVTSLNRAFLRQATEALAPLDLELFEYDVLSALRRQGRPYALPATGIARETGLSSGAMTNRIDKLESRGLVIRKGDKGDRRTVIVSLTAAGKRAIRGCGRKPEGLDLSRTKRTFKAATQSPPDRYRGGRGGVVKQSSCAVKRRVGRLKPLFPSKEKQQRHGSRDHDDNGAEKAPRAFQPGESADIHSQQSRHERQGQEYRCHDR